MTKKIFQSILLVAGCVLLASLLIIMGFLYDYFGGVEENQLRDELSLAAAAVEDGGTDYLSRLTADRYRLTWIAADGSVLYDTKTNAESLENHASRAEVSQALATGTGESTRYSSTLMEKTMYYAQRLDDGTVLRISISRATVGMIAVGMIQPLLIVLIVALILSGLLARRLSRRIVDPLNSLDLEHPLDNDAYEELSPLLKRIHHQHVEIQTQLRELREKTDEFTQITGSMREGLVLLDEHGSILSINAAAQALFGADAQCVGRDFLTIERSHEISAAIQAAAADGHSEVRAERAGHVYQFDISRITSDGKFLGTVILAFDITEQEFAERNRREFTANVSHELKTPLQGIIGSAELIENGMVKPEDLPRFVGHIHAEAARLVTLIDDIIRLSQLDEGDAMPTEPVDLLAVSQEAAENLHEPDASMFHRLNEASGGMVRLITVAPEEEGAIPFIREVSQTCTVSLGHTTAGYETAMAAYGAGASHATHLFNAMPSFLHREPGVIGAALDSGATVELICDGLHIHPAVIRATHKLFGDKLVIISDSLRCAGMPDGEYELGGQPVFLQGGVARLSDGTIAGSATNVYDCMLRAISFGIPREDAVRAATYNPARQLGCLDEVGSIRDGKQEQQIKQTPQPRG